MRSLSPLILFLGLAPGLNAQSPHGADFKISCSDCHSSFSWAIDADTLSFNHAATAFPLAGQHTRVDCRQCHQTLVFPEANTECISCHTDMHRATVGADCARCHTPDNWLVDNITGLHYDNGFPLLGIHTTLDCDECHMSASSLEFNRIGNECMNCHLDDYLSAAHPNHQGAGFSTNCVECHREDGFDWSSESIDHGFFPLEKGHDIGDCARCHSSGNFSATPTDCFACHQPDYENTFNPNHQSAGFVTSCAECHTTDVGWMPAEYAQHDAFFPIYSGEHGGEWAQCADCHNNPSNYAEFMCISCHVNPEMDEKHAGVSGYVYENTACLACHPGGSAGNSFDHNNTNFPLTGGHMIADCILCHADGYQGTPTECEACHLADFNNSANPSHPGLGLPRDCASCHTTSPGWNPASFDIHNNYYPLHGAHAGIANDCAACHNGDYNNTPNTCYGCHADDYNQAADPSHTAAQFPTDCGICHTETAWAPANFDHDGMHFPIYSGKHREEWNECVDCHTTPGNYSVFSCIDCHAHNNPQQLANDHNEVAGYVFESNACFECHPAGDAH